MIKSAVISNCGKYRYALGRSWGDCGRDWPRAVVWIMLNPSTADAEFDDPTIRRCISFSQSWGFDCLRVVNLFGLRATDPAELGRVADPVGPENDEHIRLLLGEASRVIVAWGANKAVGDRAKEVLRMAQVGASMDKYPCVECLGTTAEGHPRHPLYVRADTNPIIYNPD